MGYDIYIGNAEMREVEDITEYSRVINGKIVYFKPFVAEIYQDDAPVFPNDEMTRNGNSRHPSYSTWGEFCQITGLYDLFFAEPDGLMCEHPGLKKLHDDHALAIESALASWKRDHPNACPGFEKFSWEKEVTPEGYDAIRARLIWLDWWVKWAIANCEHASIYNF